MGRRGVPAKDATESITISTIPQITGEDACIKVWGGDVGRQTGKGSWKGGAGNEGGGGMLIKNGALAGREVQCPRCRDKKRKDPIECSKMRGESR